jgi:sulfide:quinone oxidoreductase
MSPSDKPHVLIAGGGIAGLETLLALRDLAGDRVSITLLAPEPEFTYRPLTVEEPFTYSPAESRALAPIASEFDAEFVQEPLLAVCPEDRSVEIGGGTELGYDAVVVCVGGNAQPAYRAAATFWPGADPLHVVTLLQDAAGSATRRLAFIVPPGVSWALPLYELALMSERRARDIGDEGVELVILTPESSPLILFGPGPSEEVARLLDARGIAVRTGSHVSEENGTFVVRPGHDLLEVGAAIALPTILGPAIDGLPSDEGGFIPIDEHAGVKGLDRVYAAGDGTNFPIKQGGIATQEADAAAEHIAAIFGAPVDPQPFRPVLRGKLITGDETFSMRADVAGGGGEGESSADYLWWPPHKVSARYLAPWLAGETPHRDPEPPDRSLDIEVALPKEWHREPMALDPYSSPDLG